MVKLRLKRFGRRHRPFYRLSAMDIRTPRDGMPIEELGTYDPIEKDAAKALKLNTDRVKYWLGVGAQPSDTTVTLLKQAGIEVPGAVLKRIAREAKSRESNKAKVAKLKASKPAPTPKAEKKEAAPAEEKK